MVFAKSIAGRKPPSWKVLGPSACCRAGPPLHLSSAPKIFPARPSEVLTG